jgi:hypothetical protein
MTYHSNKPGQKRQHGQFYMIMEQLLMIKDILGGLRYRKKVDFFSRFYKSKPHQEGPKKSHHSTFASKERT